MRCWRRSASGKRRRKTSATIGRHDSGAWCLEQAFRGMAAHVEMNAAMVRAIVASKRIARAVPPD